MTRNLFCLSFCVLALLTVCSQARADTLQENFGPVSVNFLSGASAAAPIPIFNPTLGTLDGVSFSYSAAAVLVQGNAISSRIEVTDSLGTLLATITFPNITGRVEQVETGSFSVPSSDLSAFESAGSTIDLTLQPFTACRGSAPTPSGCSGFTAATSGQVTYSFTPAPPPATVPEPANLCLTIYGALLTMFLARFRCASAGR